MLLLLRYLEDMWYSIRQIVSHILNSYPVKRYSDWGLNNYNSLDYCLKKLSPLYHLTHPIQLCYCNLYYFSPFLEYFFSSGISRFAESSVNYFIILKVTLETSCMMVVINALLTGLPGSLAQKRHLESLSW